MARYRALMVCRSLPVAAAAFLLGCAAPSQPAASPQAAESTPSPPSETARPPLVAIGADGTILVDGDPVEGPVEAAERLRPHLQPDVPLEILDHSDGSASLTALVAELRKIGTEHIVVRFEEAAPAPAAGGGGGIAASTEPVPPPPPGAGSLPEVQITNVGLHVGGGPNDEATKAPFQSAVAHHFDELRGCYRLVDKPERGGVFGVDLRIPGQGGKPAIQAKRTAMGGEEFRQCVLDVFGQVEFARPPRGPTVISYSVRFALDD